MKRIERLRDILWRCANVDSITCVGHDDVSKGLICNVHVIKHHFNIVSVISWQLVHLGVLSWSIRFTITLLPTHMGAF